MRAGVIHNYGNPDVFRIYEVAYPQLTARGVIVKVMASSVNPIDCVIRKGKLKNQTRMNFPMVLGYDLAGEIVNVGSEVKKYKVGDLVYCSLNSNSPGAYAQYVLALEDTIA
nr:alcohol dehydrogenase catalytic domain-containing protein [Bacteroidota bacterium]